MTDIQRRIDEKNERNAFSRGFHAQSDKDAIAAWKQDFLRILQIFNVCSAGPQAFWFLLTVLSQTELHLNVLVGFEDLRQDLSAIKNGMLNQHHVVSVVHSSKTRGH